MSGVGMIGGAKIGMDGTGMAATDTNTNIGGAPADRAGLPGAGAAGAGAGGEGVAGADAGAGGIAIRLNGAAIALPAATGARLLDLLRDDLGLTAAKSGCDIGRCGACMVLLDGEPANACLLLDFQLAGAEVVTPEGLGRMAEAQVVRTALAEENAFQCGYCASGIVTVLTALFRARPEADEAAIRAALAGNLCRCTGYHSILRGALLAAARLSAAPTASG